MRPARGRGSTLWCGSCARPNTAATATRTVPPGWRIGCAGQRPGGFPRRRDQCLWASEEGGHGIGHQPCGRRRRFCHYDGQHDTRFGVADSTTAGPVTTTDPLTAIGIQTLSQADVEHERDRADQAERQVEIEWQLVEEGRKRIDELQASLADERRRIDGLHTELADARTMAMISGSEAAVLRTQLTLLTDKRRRP